MISKIINELSVDCDKFFDEVADLNQERLDNEKSTNIRKEPDSRFQKVGLYKSIFVNTLNKYGVSLSEKENALISSVFSLSKEDRDKLDYVKIDKAFEDK